MLGDSDPILPDDMTDEEIYAANKPLKSRPQKRGAGKNFFY